MALPCFNLNLNLYRVFYTVAKTKSFSESSRSLHISQPAISKHIQNLEYELKTLLFYRTNRGIELTPEAKALLVYVEKAWNFLCLGEKQLIESKELVKGKVSIGSPTFIGMYYLDDFVKDFMKNHPNLIIKIANDENKSLMEMFRQHTLDILVTIAPIEIAKDLKTITLTEDEYCFVYNKEKFSITENVTLEELVTYPILLPDKSIEQRKKMEKMFYSNNLKVAPAMELNSNELIMRYTKEGIGIGCILKSIALKDSDLEIINIDNMPKEEIYLIYNEVSLTNATREFIKLITNDHYNY